jgi:hypothetical protein
VKKVISRFITLEELVKLHSSARFSVPIYQRLYVWGDDQVRTLLEDLNNTYQQNKDIYFLGGVVIVEREDRYGKHFELIDGQQRFTTLWLLSAAWREALESFLAINLDGQKHARIQFAIRPEVNIFLSRLIEKATGSESVEEVKATKYMRDAISLVQAFINDKEQKIENLVGITNFIFTQVKMVLTTVPSGTDLNKLFEIINNRGVQLKHHEILKARMLEFLNGDERVSYATLWDACADMGDYIEKNIRDLAKLKVADLFDSEKAKKDSEPLASAKNVLAALYLKEEDGSGFRQPLVDILRPLPDDNNLSGNGKKADNNEDSDRVKSIFGFPVFLQHVLRIWLKENGRNDLSHILDRELLELFENNLFKPSETNKDQLASDVRSFIELLWELRYLFDKYIIKWVDRGEERQHLICTLRLSENSLIRDHEETGSVRGFSLLQSMLYHSQQITTQYWLTPLLSYIWKNKQGVDNFYRYLRHLDNHLLCTDDEGDLILRTRKFLDKPDREAQLIAAEVLKQPLGVKFPHYWFYKLEFILWYQGPDSHGVAKEAALWKSFRFTAKNSVEHVSPQTRQDVDRFKFSSEMLDRFGNLALVSRSINSEYGNKPFNEKREHFLNRNQTKLDSLKMFLIYKNDSWNDELANKHEHEMLSAFQSYMIEPCSA